MVQITVQFIPVFRNSESACTRSLPVGGVRKNFCSRPDEQLVVYKKKWNSKNDKIHCLTFHPVVCRKNEVALSGYWFEFVISMGNAIRLVCNLYKC